MDVLGVALATANVSVNGQSTYRKVECFRKKLSVANSLVPVWQPVSVAATGETTGSGNVFVPKTPEEYDTAQDRGYDDDGNQLRDGRWTYEWDAENRLKAMRSLAGSPAPERRLEVVYDSLGRRIRKTVWDDRDDGQGAELSDTLYVYDGWNLLAELDANSSNAKVRSYVWGLDLSGAGQGAGVLEAYWR